MFLALAKHFETATSKLASYTNEKMVEVRKQLSNLRLPDEIVFKLDKK